MFKQGDALFELIEARLDAGAGGPSLHGGAQQLLHEMAEGDTVFGRSALQGLHQGGLEGHVQLSSFGSGHCSSGSGEVFLSVLVGSCPRLGDPDGAILQLLPRLRQRQIPVFMNVSDSLPRPAWASRVR